MGRQEGVDDAPEILPEVTEGVEVLVKGVDVFDKAFAINEKGHIHKKRSECKYKGIAQNET